MSLFLKNNLITEINYGNDFSYILNDNNKFLSTEYKISKNLENVCFLKCMKTLYNGKIQFYYLVESYKTFESIIPTLESENFITILENMLANIIEIKNNGFLACNSINISFDKIYVDPDTYKVKFVYLPIMERVYKDKDFFENELRKNLVELISNSPKLLSSNTKQIILDLTNNPFSLEELYNRMKIGSNYNFDETAEYTDKEVYKQTNKRIGQKMRLVSIDDSNCTVIEVTKNDFTIGKKASEVDGAVSINRLISRIHCKIVKESNQYKIIDLLSVNGTYVNSIRVKPNEAYPVQNGDVIHLANSGFRVMIE